MKVRYEISSSEFYDKNGDAVLWTLFIDGQQFDFDMDDLMTMANILKAFFEGTGIEEGVIFPLMNREKVIHEA